MASGNDTAEVRGNRGWANYRLGEYEKALADYDQAITMDSQHADNLNERGLVHHGLGDYEEALADYDRSLKIRPDDTVILTNRAITHVRIGNVEKARADLDQAIARDPKYVTARLERVWLLINGGKPDAALAEMSVIEDSGTLDVFGLEARGRARLDIADWKGTIADADQALALGSTFDWPYEYRALARRGLGDYEGSVADATVVIRRNPKNMRMLVTRAISLQLSGRLEAALAEMDQAAKDGADSAYAYEIRSYLNLRAGRLKDAVADARQSVQLAPQSQYSAVQLGWTLLFNGEPTAAVIECGRSLSIIASPGAYSCRAVAALAMGKPDPALIDATQAVAIDSLASIGHLALGRISLVQGKVEEAKRELDQALRLDPLNKPEILMYRGDAERALGNVAEARRLYREARTADLGLFGKALDERMAALAAP